MQGNANYYNLNQLAPHPSEVSCTPQTPPKKFIRAPHRTAEPRQMSLYETPRSSAQSTPQCTPHHSPSIIKKIAFDIDQCIADGSNRLPRKEILGKVTLTLTLGSSMHALQYSQVLQVRGLCNHNNFIVDKKWFIFSSPWKRFSYSKINKDVKGEGARVITENRDLWVTDMGKRDLSFIFFGKQGFKHSLRKRT